MNEERLEEIEGNAHLVECDSQGEQCVCLPKEMYDELIAFSRSSLHKAKKL